MYLWVNIKYTKNTKNAEYEVRCKDGIILNLVRMTYDTILHTVLWEKNHMTQRELSCIYFYIFH